MTRVDFYVLEDVGQAAAMRFACQLALRARQNDMPVHIHTGTEADAEAVDALLWDYPAHRFLPHARLDLAGDTLQLYPIHIGFTATAEATLTKTAAPRLDNGCMINLAPDVPQFFGRFDRVAEIIVADQKEAGRARYRHYQTRGYHLSHHDIKDWEN